MAPGSRSKAKSNVFMRDVVVQGLGAQAGTGITIAGYSTNAVTTSYTLDNVFVYGKQIGLEFGNYLQGIIVVNSTIFAVDTGIQYTSSLVNELTVIANTNIAANDTAIDIAGTSADPVNVLQISTVYAYGQSSGSTKYFVSLDYLANFTMSGMVVGAETGQVMSLTNSSAGRVTGSQFYGTVGAVIDLAGSTGIQFIGNEFDTGLQFTNLGGAEGSKVAFACNYVNTQFWLMGLPASALSTGSAGYVPEGYISAYGTQFWCGNFGATLPDMPVAGVGWSQNYSNGGNEVDTFLNGGIDWHVYKVLSGVVQYGDAPVLIFGQDGAIGTRGANYDMGAQASGPSSGQTVTIAADVENSYIEGGSTFAALTIAAIPSPSLPAGAVRYLRIVFNQAVTALTWTGTFGGAAMPSTVSAGALVTLMWQGAGWFHVVSA